MRSFFSSCFLVAILLVGVWVPKNASASVVGISPGSITFETLPTERRVFSFALSRANPSTDLYLRVSVSGTGSEAIGLSSGELFKLPKGEQVVSYSFSVDARKLSVGEFYAPIISFLVKNEGVPTGTDENKIQVAINGKLNIHAVEKLTEAKIRAFSTPEDVPDGLMIRNVRLEKNDQPFTKEIVVRVLNTLPESVDGLPYEMDVYSRKVKIGSLRGNASVLMEPGKETEFSFHYVFPRAGIYRLEFVLGTQIKTKQIFVFAPYFGLERVLFSSIPPTILFLSAFVAFFTFLRKKMFKHDGQKSFLWIFIFCLIAGFLWCANIMLLLGKFETVPLANLAVQKGMFYFKKEESDDEIISLLTGKKQPLFGNWNVFVSSNENTFLFPSRNTSAEEEKNARFFRINNQEITAVPTSVLPGTVFRVEENIEQTYVLFEGITSENTSFSCVAEAQAVSRPNCSWMKDVGITHAEDVQFSKKTPQYILYRQNNHFFVYDFWTQTTFVSQEQGAVIAPQKEHATNLLIQQADKRFFPWMRFGKEYFFLHPSSNVFSLGDQVFLEKRFIGSEQDVFLLFPQKKQRAFLARVKNGDELYFLKRGVRIMTP